VHLPIAQKGQIGTLLFYEFYFLNITIYYFSFLFCCLVVSYSETNWDGSDSVCSGESDSDDVMNE
jgi:hypothetical protein